MSLRGKIKERIIDAKEQGETDEVVYLERLLTLIPIKKNLEPDELDDALEYAKHYGPGSHASGSDQDVHGSGFLSHYRTKSDKDLIERVQTIRTLNAPKNRVRALAELFTFDELRRVKRILERTAIRGLHLNNVDAALAFAKHLGPGDHPSGSPQTVHGAASRGLAANQRITDLKEGGFTRHIPTGKVPTTGYSVALPGHEQHTPLSKVNARWVRNYRRQHQAALNRAETSWGGWVYDGDAYLDVSVIVKDRAQAIALGVKYKQIAIWDIEQGEEITIGQRIAARFSKGAIRRFLIPKDATDEEVVAMFTKVEKHMGPGPHPSGSDQSVHNDPQPGGESTPKPKGTASIKKPPQKATPQQARTGDKPQSNLGTKENPIRTGDVDEAMALIERGAFVELTQPRQVSTLLDRLGQMVTEAESLGEKAPNYNLCLVSVKGTNIFCSASKGIKRIDMPQLSGKAREGSPAEKFTDPKTGEANAGKAFADHLKSRGITVTEGTEKASYLRASQMELVGSKVAGIAKAYRAGTYDPTKETIFISNDGYIVDGHHRWAAVVGVDLADNIAGDLDMNVQKIDLGIMEVLAEAKEFSETFGILPKMGKRLYRSILKHLGPGRHPSGSEQSVHGGLNVLANAKIHLTNTERLKVAHRPGIDDDPDVRANARRRFVEAIRNERIITPTLLQVKEATGGEFEFFEERVKLEPSIRDKIRRIQEEEAKADKPVPDPAAAADLITDLNRYTFIFANDERFAQSVSVTRAAMAEAGFTIPPGKDKNFFVITGDTYDGINYKFQSDDVFVEVQFHTPESAAIKAESEKLYAVARNLPDDSPQRATLIEQMKKLWNTTLTHIPPGIANLGTPAYNYAKGLFMKTRYRYWFKYDQNNLPSILYRSNDQDQLEIWGIVSRKWKSTTILLAQLQGLGGSSDYSEIQPTRAARFQKGGK